MDNLTEAILKGAAHIRDPIGGSNETLFVYVRHAYLLTYIKAHFTQDMGFAFLVRLYRE